MTTVSQEVFGIRGLLNDPLPQSPSFEDILEEMEAEYQQVTNQTNNTDNAWQKGQTLITTVAGTLDYQVSTVDDDFFKPLVVLSVPANDSTPEYTLEFTELEHIQQEWPWTGQNQGLYSSAQASSQFAAFYHKITDSGNEIWLQLRPAPSKVEQYKIIYQVGDWWNRIFQTQDLGFSLPYDTQKHYVRTLVALNLLPKCKWSGDSKQNIDIKLETVAMLNQKLARYKPTFDQFITSLTVQDVVYGENYADSEGIW